MACYESERIRWTTKEFSVKEIIEKFSEYLPFLAIVTQGYCSSRLEIPSDQIFWIRDVTKHRRMVARYELQKYYSIPECYKQQVQQLIRIDNKEFTPVGDLMTVEELMRKERARYFQFVGESPVKVISDDNEDFYTKLGHLELIDSYEEKFLVAHPLFSDESLVSSCTSKGHFMVLPEINLLPVDTPMMLAIAVGLKTGSDRTFFRILLKMRRFADNCDKDYAKHIAKIAEITTFKETPASNSYDYIELSTRSRTKTKNRPKSTGADDKHVWKTSLVERLQMLKEVCEFGTPPADSGDKPALSGDGTSAQSSEAQHRVRGKDQAWNSSGGKIYT